MALFFLCCITVWWPLLCNGAVINKTESNEDWRFVCGPQKIPVQGLRVSLVEVSQNWHLLATKITNERGQISFPTGLHKNDDLIFRIFYSYEPLVDQEDETPFSISHENETVNEDSILTEEFLLDENVQKIKNITLSDAPCLAFVNIKRALDDFRTTTGRQGHPAGALKLIFSKHIGDAFNAPFSTLDTIQMPLDYRMSYQAALHELAHTLRQSLDGSYSHFLNDLAQYSYTQPHACTSQTNNGFAFNEGWAHYWSNATNCFVSREWAVRKNGSTKGEYLIEGRVASALLELGLRCHGSTEHRKKFYDLLDENPLRIHSFKEFLKLHQEKYDCGLTSVN